MANTSNSSQRTTISDRSWTWAWVMALTVLVWAVYGNSLRVPFLFDDLGAVVGNPTIRRLDSLDVLHPPTDGSTTTGRPLLNLSYAFNYALSREAVMSYHVVNVGIHLLCALLLMGIVRRTLLGETDSGQRRFAAVTAVRAQAIAWFVAALWAVHPLQTETVVSVAQRSESLCSLFYLLTLYAFIRATDAHVGSALARGLRFPAPTRGWLTISVLSCLVGMACKEIMVTAPVLVWLYDRTFIAGTFLGAMRRRLPYYAALASTWLLLGWLVLSGSGSRGVAAGVGLGVSSWEYLLTQARALVIYLKLSLWPYPLILDYGTGVDRQLAQVGWQAAIAVTLLAVTIWALVRRPIIGFFGAWFFVILAPSSSVVPLVAQTIAEHRMYLPLASVVGLMAWTTVRFFGPKAGWMGAVVVLGLGGLTIARNHDYADPLTLWADSAEKYPASARAQNNLGIELDRVGKRREAMERFARAASLDPTYSSPYYHWGRVLLAEGSTRDAIEKLETAVKLAPAHADAHLALGNAFVRAGAVADAVPHYEAALTATPGADVHYNLGVALVALARDVEAKRHFEAALEFDPSLAEASFQLARIAERAGQTDEAFRRLGETLRLAPDHVGAHRRLGMAAVRAEQFEEAAKHFSAIVRVQPDDADAWANLGNTFLARGQPQEAIKHYEQALRLRPDDRRSLENLRLAREALSGR